jgi:chorismate mutase/prephenate dehydratase
MRVADERTRLEQLRREIDELDRRIVGLLNERARKGREVGHEKASLGWTQTRDPEREREVLLRISMANEGPIAQEDLLAIYRRVIDATRALEDRDRERIAPDGTDGADRTDPTGADATPAT